MYGWLGGFALQWLRRDCPCRRSIPNDWPRSHFHHEWSLRAGDDEQPLACGCTPKYTLMRSTRRGSGGLYFAGTRSAYRAAFPPSSLCVLFFARPVCNPVQGREGIPLYLPRRRARRGFIYVVSISIFASSAHRFSCETMDTAQDYPGLKDGEISTGVSPSHLEHLSK